MDCDASEQGVEAIEKGISGRRISEVERRDVDVAEEMVNLIITQRAFEVNSKAVTTADQLLEIANSLKR